MQRAEVIKGIVEELLVSRPKDSFIILLMMVNNDNGNYKSDDELIKE
jgi:hypothetical protein